MLIRFLRMLVFERITGRMNKSALLGTPFLNIAPEGINNRGEIVKKMVRSYPSTTRRA